MANSNDNSQILGEGTQRNQGKSAQRMNILAAKLVAEAVRTTLGPKGMDKMLVDSLGEVIVTNDGVTILKEMDIEHPSAKMIIEVAKTQEDEVGDGTTTAVVIAGELLRKAEELLDQNIHPTVIAKGYRLAGEKSKELLKSYAIEIKDQTVLKKICETAMTGKGAEDTKQHLSNIIIEAVSLIRKHESENKRIIDDIKLEKKTGGALEESELIKGLVIDKEKVHSSMPSSVNNAKIALINSPIEVRSPETDTKISISDPEKIQGFLDMEENMIKKIISKIKESGANVVFCQKGIDDLAQHFLQKNGIYACRRVKKSDLERLAKATDAKIVTDINELSKDDLGFAGLVESVRVSDEYMTYVRDCKDPKSLTILVRGSTEHIADEAARAVEDAIGDVNAALSNNKVVPGAAATEIRLAKDIQAYSDTLSGREQLAVKAFSETLEIIPKTLAENAGLDPIDILTELKSSKEKNAGIDSFTGKIVDSWKSGIIEPLKIKTQAISSATEVAIMILRIDDVILAGTKNKEQEEQ